MKYYHKDPLVWWRLLLMPLIIVLIALVALVVTATIIIHHLLDKIPSYHRWYEINYNEDSLRYKLWKAVERTEHYRK